MEKTTTAPPSPDSWSPALETRVRAALREIRFGTVTLVIQDGRVIQIDKSEKIRLEQNKGAGS